MTAQRKAAVRRGSISGRVSDALGPPLDGVEVTATGPDGSVSATTTLSGEYAIPGLAPGDHTVNVRPPAGFSGSPARKVSVPPAANVPDVDFRLQQKPIAVTGPTGPASPGITGPSLPAPTAPTPMASTPTGPTPTAATPTGVTSTSPSTGPTSTATGVTGPATGSSAVDEFLRLLLSDDLNIEGPVAEDEALEAIALFAVANVLIAGLSRRRVGAEDKIDVLGMLTLYYGLQDKSLSPRVVLNSRDLWRAPINGGGTRVEDELKSLRDLLDRLGQDVTFVSREAKRQFNLGINNDVTANVTFPGLVKRMVEIAADPRLTLDLRAEDQAGSVTSKDKIGEAYDLLAELKHVSLRVVRSLSRYGTIAVHRTTRDWAAFENRAFTVLRKTAEQRFTEDIDDKRILSVLADLLDKSFETTIAPYFTMARNGTALLSLAFETYQAAKSDLDDFDRDHLLGVFQRQGPAAAYLTTRMRTHALVMKRYPLQAWN